MRAEGPQGGVGDRERLVAFAEKAWLPVGFGYLLSDGTLDPHRPLETWINARMTHVFSLEVLAGNARAEAFARHGVEALQGVLRDDVHGGWFSEVPGDGRKSAYQHAFVVLAGASASHAGISGGRELLRDALDVWQTRFWDDGDQAAVDEWDRSWDTCADYRGANANMHGVEAMLAAADAVEQPDRGRLLEQCLQVTRRIVHEEAGRRGWRLPEHFTSDWAADLDHNRDRPADPFQPYGVTVGHQFEWSRLAIHLHQALGRSAPGWLLEDARSLFDAARSRGSSRDPGGGFVYTLGWDDQPVVATRVHWVLAEAIAAAAVLAKRFPSEDHLSLHAQWTQVAAQAFADHRTGNWHHELTADGSPAYTIWSGQPDVYHVYQALLLSKVPLAGSLAASMLAGPT